MGKIDIRVGSRESAGNLLVVEMTHNVRGGPGLHLHPDQDEWFFVVEGDYILEVGGRRRLLRSGESCFGPRNVPHSWSFASDGIGRIVFVFSPAGQMEPFFRKIAEAGVIPLADAALFQAHGMELVGPPL